MVILTSFAENDCTSNIIHKAPAVGLQILIKAC